MRLIYFSLMICWCTWTIPTFAGILSENTRVVYDESASSKSFIIVNKNTYPILVQTWVDYGLGYPNKENAPFVVYPPVFKMKPDAIQVLKIIYTGDKTVTDKELQFWLNLYEIPGKNKEQWSKESESTNRLGLSVQTQLKLFYRPKKIVHMNVEDVAKQLKFYLKKSDHQVFLVCKNPTPYFISFSKIELISDVNHIVIEDHLDQMVAPQSEQAYPVKHNVTDIKDIAFSLISDDGFAYSFQYNFFSF